VSTIEQHPEQKRHGSDQPKGEMLLRFEKPDDQRDQSKSQRDIDHMARRQIRYYL
jgi:hypothetical protein